MSCCGSKAGCHTWTQLQQCSGSPGQWVLQHSMSKALPGRNGHSSSPASGSGQRSPHEAKHVDIGLPITFHPLWGAAAVLPPWPGSCHSLCVTGRSSSTSPASSLPTTGENHFISSPRNIRDHVLQCLLALLHPSDPKVPPLPTPTQPHRVIPRDPQCQVNCSGEIWAIPLTPTVS